MDLMNVRASRAQAHVPVAPQPAATPQISHSPNLRTPGQAMSTRLHKHFTPHLEKDADSGQPVAAGSSARNAELDAIRAHRAEELEKKGFTEDDMEEAEKNASRADRVFASIKSGMGGTPFAVLTLAGNFKPSILQVGGVSSNAVLESAKGNAMSSLYAQVADVSVNKMMAGLKPGYYLKPDAGTLHPALQDSVAEKLLALDKGPLRNAFNEANKWLTGFAIRDAAMFGSTLAMTAAGQAKLDAILQPALRPVTAILVGVLIEHYNVSRDRANHIADPAMLYGRRDAVQEGHASKPIDQDREWLAEFETLKNLNTTALVQMVSARLGEGAAVALNSVISGDAFKEVLDPSSILGGGALTAGFAAMGAGATATAELAKANELGELSATAASQGVKNVLSTLAFGLWAAGASLGESVPKKLATAIDANVPKAVENGANATGRGVVEGGKAVVESGKFVGRTSLTASKIVQDTALSVGRGTRDAVHAAGDGVSSAWDMGKDALTRRQAPSSPDQAAQGPGIQMQPLASTSAPASSSAPTRPRPAAQDGSDMV